MTRLEPVHEPSFNELSSRSMTRDVGALGWWDLFINFGYDLIVFFSLTTKAMQSGFINCSLCTSLGRIAECFSFLVCTKWSNPAIHRLSHHRGPSSSSQAIRYLDWNSGLVVSTEEDESQNHMCSPPRILGTPQSARYIPLAVLFLPLFVLQGIGVVFALSRLVEKIILLLNSGTRTGRYFSISSRACDWLGFFHHGSRLLGWWSIDESSKEEQARLFHSANAGYNTFCGPPPEVVKKMPKKDLAEEVWRLQAALGEQAEITKYSQQEYERLQNEKVLCRICFESDIGVVLLPCRHRILCSTCCEKCKKCPICRMPIEERMPVYDIVYLPIIEKEVDAAIVEDVENTRTRVPKGLTWFDLCI
ncbi:RING finger protein B [Nymphaea thermarum]|nr:RING finger protein B [Nymphaea thermarum]